MEIPVGAQADILLPPEQGEKVTLNGIPRTGTRFTLGSGIYEFTAKH